MPALTLPDVRHRTVSVDGVEIAYREAGDRRNPTLLLLHGFPSASHQYRRLIDALGGDYHVVAPDYPGFGESDVPAPDAYAYSFDHVAETIDRFCDALGLVRFFLYLFDFGAPVGMRLAVARPARIRGLIAQNGNVYAEGLSEQAAAFVALRPDDDGAVDTVASLLTLEGTRGQYLTGVEHEDRIAPESWRIDQAYLDLDGRVQPQLDLAFDYKRNVERYPEWQRWLRDHAPPALVVWGRNDPFFVEAGAWAFRADLPSAEVHVFDTGHFALEEHVSEIAALVADFVDRHAGT